MFEAFARIRTSTSGAVIHGVRAGRGLPVLLLHGYPQTHAMWHKIAPKLAQDFTVIATDLRGYGDSSKPDGGPDHSGYSKRAMAQDQVEVMGQLGFEEFFVVGHDRGARVAHRMALDHPRRVKKLAILDIVPTHRVFATVNKEVATSTFHWFFLIQPYDFPETLIGANPEYYLRKMLERWSGGGLAAFAPEALAEYIRCFNDPGAIHASCEDYRAAATIDLVHDEADLGRKVGCPVLVLWGEQYLGRKNYDVLAAWRERTADVRGRVLSCGHFPPEEAPDETYAALREFLTG